MKANGAEAPKPLAQVACCPTPVRARINVLVRSYEQDDRRPSRAGGGDKSRKGDKGGKGKKSAQAEEEEENDDDETTEEFLGGGTVVSTDVATTPAESPSQAPSRSETYNETRESRDSSSRDSSSSSSGGSNGYQRSSTASVGMDGSESTGEPVRTREENMAFYNGGRSSQTKPQSAGSGGEGGRGVRGSGSRIGDEPFRGQRQYMTEEQLAKREESSAAVKAATTWRELANVLRERSGALDAVHISTMLTKVWDENQKPTDPDSIAEYEALIGSLYGWVAQLLPQCRPINTSSIIYSISKLQYFNAELVAGLTARALEQKGNFTIRDFGMMMSAYGSLGHNPGPDFLAAVYRSYSGKIAMRVASVHDIATVLGILVKFGATPTQEWLEGIATTASQMARQFNDVQWGTVIYALAALGYSGGDGEWLTLMTTGQGKRCGFLFPERLNKVTWALTQFPHRPSTQFLSEVLVLWSTKMRLAPGQMLSAISYNLAYLQAPPAANTVTIFIKALDAKRETLSGDELANIVMTLAIWNHKPEARWVDELAILVRSKLPQCTADGLTKIQSALPLLGNGHRLKQVVAEAEQYALQLQETEAAAQAQQYGDAIAQQEADAGQECYAHQAAVSEESVSVAQ